MTDPSSHGWSRCPPGTFRRLAAELTARRLRRLWFTRLAWVTAAALAVGLGWQATAAVSDWSSGKSAAPAEHCAPVPSQPAKPPANGKS